MHQKTPRDAYRSVERHYVPEWLTHRIQVANFDLVDHMIWLLQEAGGFNEILRVERKEIEHFTHNAQSLRNLLRTPFLMIAPTLETVEDWRGFIDETPTTLAVDELRRKLPPMRAMTRHMVEQHNRIFVDLITSVIHMNVLAAPLLGITTELAKLSGIGAAVQAASGAAAHARAALVPLALQHAGLLVSVHGQDLDRRDGRASPDANVADPHR